MKYIFPIVLFFLIQLTAYTQNFNLKIVSLWDNRDTGFGGSTLTIYFKSEGFLLDDLHMLKIDTVYSVIDDLGNDHKVVWRGRLFQNKYITHPNQKLHFYTAKNPPRNALSITIRLAAKYFVPSPETGSKLSITWDNQKFNTNILKGLNNEIVLIPLNTKSLSRLRAESSQKYYDEVTRILKQASIGEDLTKKIKIQTSYEYSKSLYVFPIITGDEDPMYFFIDNPKNRMLQVTVYNADHKKILGSTRNGSETIISQALTENLTNGSTIEILIETEKSVKFYPFEFKDVKLP